MSSNIVKNTFYEDVLKGIEEDDNLSKTKKPSEEIIDAEVITVSKIKYETLGKAFTELIREVSDDELTDKFVAFIKAGKDLGMEMGNRGLAKDLQIGGAFELAGETVGLVKDIANIFMGDKAPGEKIETSYATSLDENQNISKNFNIQLENKSNEIKQLPFNGGENGLVLENKTPIKPLNPNSEVKALESPKPFVLTGKYSGKAREVKNKDR